jgi:hypothetical protein
MRRKTKFTAFGHVLILACSQSKNEGKSPAPAIHLYDGVNYRVLRKVLFERGWPPGLQIKILSAKYGLIDATTLIEPYELRLDVGRAVKINKQVVKQLIDLKKSLNPSFIFVNLGSDYLPAIKGLEDIFPDSKIAYAKGAIGFRMHAMKEWLERLHYRTATVHGLPIRRQSYLYFFPDWDDFIYEPFTANDNDCTQGTKTYAYEACGNRIPFDGVLFSLSHIYVGKGALHRFTDLGDHRIWLRRRLRIPQVMTLFGDCGAFSYVNEPTPPFSPDKAAELYHRFGFDIGASVDHIPLPEITIRQDDGTVQKKVLSDSTRYRRMYLTRDNAEKFLNTCKSHNYKFVPLGVIQGIGVSSYADRLHEYIDMGYQHIALGGLVPRTDDEILEILCRVRHALQLRTVSSKENTWIHLFGILRPKLQPIFRELGVSSFDSASFFRKSWLRSDQNYLAPDGRRWYGTIRIPHSTSKPMRQAAIDRGISENDLTEMERSCLDSIEACGVDPSATQQVLQSVERYGPLLERRSEDNHFARKHALLLKDRPWESCQCPFCRSAGIHIVVFRGASRNKRRGLHNTWVLYHKILRGHRQVEGEK